MVELKKYGVPEGVGMVIDLSEIEEENVLSSVSEKISDRVDHYSSLLEGLVQPESNFSNLYEYEAFSEKERDKITNTYRKLMYLSRAYGVADLQGEDDSYKDFIEEFWDSWKGLKKELEWISERLKDCWNGDRKMKLELGYFG